MVNATIYSIHGSYGLFYIILIVGADVEVFFHHYLKGTTRFDTPNLPLARSAVANHRWPDAWERLLCILPVAWNYLMTSNTSTFHYLIYGLIVQICFSHPQRLFLESKKPPNTFGSLYVSLVYAQSSICQDWELPDGGPMSLANEFSWFERCPPPFVAGQTFRCGESVWENRGTVWGHTYSVAVARSMRWDHQSLLWSATGTDCSGTSNDCSTVLVMSTSAIDRFYDSLTQALTCILLLQEVYLAAHLSMGLTGLTQDIGCLETLV